MTRVKFNPVPFKLNIPVKQTHPFSLLYTGKRHSLISLHSSKKLKAEPLQEEACHQATYGKKTRFYFLSGLDIHQFPPTFSNCSITHMRKKISFFSMTGSCHCDWEEREYTIPPSQTPWPILPSWLLANSWLRLLWDLTLQAYNQRANALLLCLSGPHKPCSKLYRERSSFDSALCVSESSLSLCLFTLMNLEI